MRSEIGPEQRAKNMAEENTDYILGYCCSPGERGARKHKLIVEVLLSMYHEGQNHAAQELAKAVAKATEWRPIDELPDEIDARSTLIIDGSDGTIVFSDCEQLRRTDYMEGAKYFHVVPASQFREE